MTTQEQADEQWRDFYRPRLIAGGVDPIPHHWLCRRPAPVESVTELPNGQALVIATCPQCGATDESSER